MVCLLPSTMSVGILYPNFGIVQFIFFLTWLNLCFSQVFLDELGPKEYGNLALIVLYGKIFTMIKHPFGIPVSVSCEFFNCWMHLSFYHIDDFYSCVNKPGIKAKIVFFFFLFFFLNHWMHLLKCRNLNKMSHKLGNIHLH